MFEILQLLSKCNTEAQSEQMLLKLEVLPQIFNLQTLQYVHRTIKQDMPVFLITHAKQAHPLHMNL